MSLKIYPNEDKCLYKAEFQNDLAFFGDMVFDDIGKLNVITGPNGVGKSLLLNKMNTELSKERWKNENIYPVLLRFNADSVKATFNNDDYSTKVTEGVNSHNEYKEKCNRLNDDFTDDSENPVFKKHKTSYDRYNKVYPGKENKIVLQMNYEFGMSHDDMKDENSIVNYFRLHKLIKFGTTDTDTDSTAIDINSHLKDFKYEIDEEYTSSLVFKKKGDNSKTVDLTLSSGERTYFMLLLWDIISKINKNLIQNEGHKGLVANGGKYVFLLG